MTAPNGTTLNNTASVTGTKSAQNFTTPDHGHDLVQGGGGCTAARPDDRQDRPDQRAEVSRR